MKRTFLVGLTGKAGSGKDTVAGFLGWDTYAFAQPLKRGLAAMGFEEPERKLKEQLIPGFDFTWRAAAQKLGTEWGRSLQSDIWLSMAKRARQRTAADIMVITDVRFHNEADWVRDNGVLLHVLGREYAMAGDAAVHASEHGIPVDGTKDFLIDNKGSLDELVRQVHALLPLILKAQREQR